MNMFRWTCRSLVAAALIASASPALAQSNVSDVTGGNVSDVTGGNVSDITGGNVSDVTGADTASGPARRATALGLNQEDADNMASDLDTAYAECSSGGDCTRLNEILSLSEKIFEAE